MMWKYKSLLLLLMVVCVSLTSLGQTEKKVTLTVYYPESPDYAFEVTTPVEGNYFSGNSQRYKLYPQSESKAIDLDVAEQQIITIISNFRPVNLIVNPGDQIQISFCKGDSLGITGSHAEGQLLYNKLAKDDTRSRFQVLDVSPTVEGRLYLLDSLQQVDFVAINKLLTDKKITDSFANRMKQESVMYYKLLWSTDLFFTCKSLIYGPPEQAAKVDSSFVEAWEAIYKGVTADWLTSSFFFGISIRYADLLNVSKPVDYQQPYVLNCIKFLQTVLKDEALEYAWAELMLEGVNNNENELVWIDNFNEFKSRFPGSPLDSILAPKIAGIEQYHANLAKTPTDLEVLTDIGAYNSLETLMQGLKGKWYYVDLWATWCGPCKEELQYSIKLHDELEQIGFTPFYLSIDRESDAKKWEEMVKGFPLRGLNARASAALQKGLKKEIPNFIGIPQYLIVNDKGEIVNWDAKRPSDGRELIKQLESYKRGA